MVETLSAGRPRGDGRLHSRFSATLPKTWGARNFMASLVALLGSGNALFLEAQLSALNAKSVVRRDHYV